MPALIRRPDEQVNWLSSLPFLLFHLVPLAAFFTGVSIKSLIICAACYVVRMFCITAGYHRYFSHRSYKLARVPQFLLALGGTTALQQGPLWWAAHHRAHHRNSDTDDDIHSPQKGFWWSHVGWILCDRYGATDFDSIKDFARFPELRFLDRFDWIGPSSLAIGCFLVGGWSGLVIGFFGSTILLWHGTFTVNSLAHVFGRRRYATSDTSRNSLVIALITGGEGWHNNHHHYQASARQGFFWWEFDPTYYVLRTLALVGIVKELKRPPLPLLASSRIRNGTFDLGMFRAHWAKANRAIAASRTHAAESLSDSMSIVGDAVGRRKAALEALIHDERIALEEVVAASLHAAEELARLARKRQREVGAAGPSV